MPDALVDAIDRLDGAGRRKALRVLGRAAEASGFAAACRRKSASSGAAGSPDEASCDMLARRITQGACRVGQAPTWPFTTASSRGRRSRMAAAEGIAGGSSPRAGGARSPRRCCRNGRGGAPRGRSVPRGVPRAECRSRDASKRASLLRRCALPQPKTFDGYEWGQISWPRASAGTSCCRSPPSTPMRTWCSWASRDRQDAHGGGSLHALLPAGQAGALLHGLLARDAHQACARRWQARPGALPDREGGAPGHRRAGVPAARRRRGEAAVPGGLGGI